MDNSSSGEGGTWFAGRKQGHEAWGKKKGKTMAGGEGLSLMYFRPHSRREKCRSDRRIRVSLPGLGSARASTPALPLLLPMNPAALVFLSAKWTHHHSPSSVACLDQTHLRRLGVCSSRLSPNFRLCTAGEVGKPWLQVSQRCTADLLCEAGRRGMEANGSSFKTTPTRP